MTNDSVHMITIYKYPTDYPRDYVARMYELRKGEVIPKFLLGRAKTLEDIRKIISPDMTLIPRDHNDHSSIVESYI